MVTKKSKLGGLGENIASDYLTKKGWKILERNHWEKWGELDIVAKSPDGILVFIEVKTMANDFKGGLSPEDQMTVSKIKKFARAASMYAEMNQKLIDDRKGWRMDMIALNGNDHDFDLRHYENI